MKDSSKKEESVFTGIGVGPGDPELLTLKAVRLIKEADVVAYLTNDKGESQAKVIASQCLAESAVVGEGQQMLPVQMPMKNQRDAANHAYDKAASQISEYIAAGKNVVFLCEGDPLFFGSFSYLLDRLSGIGICCDVVPGITSFSSATARLVEPLSMLTESVAILNGRHSEEKLIRALREHDSLIIMKAGPYREKILSALNKADRLPGARYLEYIGRDNELVEYDVTRLPSGKGPYFSLFIVLSENRPG